MPKKEQLLQTGKLPSEILNGLLSTITYDDERIIIGANFFTRGKFGTYDNTDLIEIK